MADEPTTRLTKSISEPADEAESISKMVDSYTSFEVMSSLVFGFAVNIFFANIGTDAFEDYYVLEIIFSNLMAVVLICNAFTMIVMSLTYFSVNRFLADKRSDIALIYLRLFSPYRKYSRRAFYSGLLIFMVAIIIYIYPQMQTVAVVTTTCTLGIGIFIIIFVLYTMINFQKVFDGSNDRKISLSAAFHRTTNASEKTHEITNAENGIFDREEERKEGFFINKNLTINDFTFIKIITGTHIMQVTKNDDGEIYALKKIRKKNLKPKQKANSLTKRDILANIDHPFIVSLRHAFQNDAKLYIVLDFFNGQTLNYYLRKEGRFSEKRSKFYTGEICLVLEYLHANGIIYGDLKLENAVLNEDGHIKITDFDISKDSLKGDMITHTFCLAPEYLAPEVLKGEQDRECPNAVDWWSLGTLLYEMMTGLPPFYNQNMAIIYEKILQAPITLPKYLSKEARSIFSGLLEKDPQKRLGSSDKAAAEIKEHPFYKDIDWKKLYNKEIEPPFKPKVVNEEDESEFESDLSKKQMNQQMEMPGFTYAGIYENVDNKLKTANS